MQWFIILRQNWCDTNYPIFSSNTTTLFTVTAAWMWHLCGNQHHTGSLYLLSCLINPDKFSKTWTCTRATLQFWYSHSAGATLYWSRMRCSFSARSVWSCRCVAFFQESGWMCGWVVQCALKDRTEMVADHIYMKSFFMSAKWSRRLGGMNIFLYCVTSLLPLSLCCVSDWTIRRLIAEESWHQTCTGANSPSASVLTVPWEQLGRISVSVAAYKGLMEAHALERRSYELSTGSLILTHTTLYHLSHTDTHTHVDTSHRHSIWWTELWTRWVNLCLIFKHGGSAKLHFGNS